MSNVHKLEQLEPRLLLSADGLMTPMDAPEIVSTFDSAIYEEANSNEMIVQNESLYRYDYSDEQYNLFQFNDNSANEDLDDVLPDSSSDILQEETSVIVENETDCEEIVEATNTSENYHENGTEFDNYSNNNSDDTITAQLVTTLKAANGPPSELNEIASVQYYIKSSNVILLLQQNSDGSIEIEFKNATIDTVEESIRITEKSCIEIIGTENNDFIEIEIDAAVSVFSQINFNGNGGEDTLSFPGIEKTLTVTKNNDTSCSISSGAFSINAYDVWEIRGGTGSVIYEFAEDIESIDINDIDILSVVDFYGIKADFVLKSQQKIYGTGDSSYNIHVQGTLAPGNSPGQMDIAGDLIWPGNPVSTSKPTCYLWEINNINGSAGNVSGWDFINVNGKLSITADPHNRFTIRITSLGDEIGFNADNSYEWCIAKASELEGFNQYKFNLDFIDFMHKDIESDEMIQYDFGNGSFAIESRKVESDDSTWYEIWLSFHGGPNLITGWPESNIYKWEINNAKGVPGSDPGWDKISIDGELTIPDNSVIEIVGLSGPGKIDPTNDPGISTALVSYSSNKPGAVAQFDNLDEYRWDILESTSTLNINPDAIEIRGSEFNNYIGEGWFELELEGNILYLHYFPSVDSDTIQTKTGDVSVVDLNDVVGLVAYSIDPSQSTDRATEIRVSQIIKNDTPNPVVSKSASFIKVVKKDSNNVTTGIYIHEYINWNNDKQPDYSVFMLKSPTDNDYDGNDQLMVIFITKFNDGEEPKTVDNVINGDSNIISVKQSLPYDIPNKGLIKIYRSNTVGVGDIYEYGSVQRRDEYVDFILINQSLTVQQYPEDSLFGIYTITDCQNYGQAAFLPIIDQACYNLSSDQPAGSPSEKISEIYVNGNIAEGTPAKGYLKIDVVNALNVTEDIHYHEYTSYIKNEEKNITVFLLKTPIEYVYDPNDKIAVLITADLNYKQSENPALVKGNQYSYIWKNANWKYVRGYGFEHPADYEVKQILLIKRDSKGNVERTDLYRCLGVEVDQYGVKYNIEDTVKIKYDKNDLLFTKLSNGLNYFNPLTNQLIYAPYITSDLIQYTTTLEDIGFFGKKSLNFIVLHSSTDDNEISDYTLEYNVQPGFTPFTLNGSVGYGGNNQFIDVLRVQQRLRMFGYKNAYGYPLAINGLEPSVRGGIECFTGAVNKKRVSIININSSYHNWLNAVNAPLWMEMLEVDPSLSFYGTSMAYSPEISDAPRISPHYYFMRGEFGFWSGGTFRTDDELGINQIGERHATTWSLEALKWLNNKIDFPYALNCMAPQGYKNAHGTGEHSYGIGLDINLPGVNDPSVNLPNLSFEGDTKATNAVVGSSNWYNSTIANHNFQALNYQELADEIENGIKTSSLPITGVQISRIILDNISYKYADIYFQDVTLNEIKMAIYNAYSAASSNSTTFERAFRNTIESFSDESFENDFSRKIFDRATVENRLYDDDFWYNVVIKAEAEVLRKNILFRKSSVPTNLMTARLIRDELLGTKADYETIGDNVRKLEWLLEIQLGNLYEYIFQSEKYLVSNIDTLLSGIVRFNPLDSNEIIKAIKEELKERVNKEYEFDTTYKSKQRAFEIYYDIIRIKEEGRGNNPLLAQKNEFWNVVAEELTERIINSKGQITPEEAKMMIVGNVETFRDSYILSNYLYRTRTMYNALIDTGYIYDTGLGKINNLTVAKFSTYSRDGLSDTDKKSIEKLLIGYQSNGAYFRVEKLMEVVDCEIAVEVWDWLYNNGYLIKKGHVNTFSPDSSSRFQGLTEKFVSDLLGWANENDISDWDYYPIYYNSYLILNKTDLTFNTREDFGLQQGLKLLYDSKIYCTDEKYDDESYKNNIYNKQKTAIHNALFKLTWQKWGVDNTAEYDRFVGKKLEYIRPDMYKILKAFIDLNSTTEGPEGLNSTIAPTKYFCYNDPVVMHDPMYLNGSISESIFQPNVTILDNGVNNYFVVRHGHHVHVSLKPVNDMLLTNYEVEFDGFMGDVIEINIKAVTSGKTFSTVASWNLEEPVVLNGKGVIFFSNSLGLGDFTSTGKLFFVPHLNGDAKSGFSGIIEDEILVIVDGKPLPLNIKINVKEGYSIQWNSQRVGFGVESSGNKKIDILKTQQRLKYLGYSGFDGSPINVNGILDENNDGIDKNDITIQAILMFQAVILSSVEEGMDVVPSVHYNPEAELGRFIQKGITETWLNNPNHPFWLDLTEYGINIQNGATNPDRYGTHWVMEVIKSAYDSIGQTGLVISAVGAVGGNRLVNGHKSGMEIDVVINNHDNPDLTEIEREINALYYRAKVFHCRIHSITFSTQHQQIVDLLKINEVFGDKVETSNEEHYCDTGLYHVTLIGPLSNVAVNAQMESAIKGIGNAVSQLITPVSDVITSDIKILDLENSAANSPYPRWGDFLDLGPVISQYFESAKAASEEPVPTFEGLKQTLNNYYRGIWPEYVSGDELETSGCYEYDENETTADKKQELVRYEFLPEQGLLYFNINVVLSKISSYELDISDIGAILGIEINSESNVHYNVGLNLNLKIGLNLKDYLSDPEDYIITKDDAFFQLDEFSIRIFADDMFSAGMRLGEIDVRIEKGNLKFDLYGNLKMNHISGEDREITISEIENGELLFDFNAQAGFQGELPILGDADLLGANAFVIIDDQDIFDDILPEVFAEGTITLNDYKLHDFLLIEEPTLSIQNNGEIIGVSASSAKIQIGDNFEAMIYDTTDDEIGIIGTYNLQNKKFDLISDVIDISVPDLFSANATNVSISYNPSAGSGQEIIGIESFTTTIIPLDTTITLNGVPMVVNGETQTRALSIRNNGFSLGEMTIPLTSSFTLGDFLEVENPTLVFSGISYSTGGELQGTIGISAAAATLFPGEDFSATFNGISGSYTLQTKAFDFTVSSFDMSLKNMFNAAGNTLHVNYVFGSEESVQDIVTLSDLTIELIPFDNQEIILERLIISDNGFSIAHLETTLDEISLADVISLDALRITLDNFAFIAGTPVTGQIGLDASSALLTVGTFSAGVSDNEMLPGAALNGSYSIADGTFSLVLEDMDIIMPGVFTADASGVYFNYDPQGTDDQIILEINSLSTKLLPFDDTVISIELFKLRRNGFSFNSFTIGINELSMGSMLSISDSSLEFSDVIYTSGQDLEGNISINAIEGALTIGDGFIASVTDAAEGDGVGISGSYEFSSDEFSLTLDQVRIEIPDILIAEVSNVGFNFQSTAPPGTTVFTIEELDAQLLPFDNVEVEIHQLIVKNDGFSIAGGSVSRNNSYVLDGFLSIETLALTVENIEYSEHSTLTGSIGLEAADAILFPGETYNAALTAISGSYDIQTKSFSLVISNFYLTLNNAINVSASDISIGYDKNDTSADQVLVHLTSGTVEFASLSMQGTIQGLTIRKNGLAFSSFSITYDGEVDAGPFKFSDPSVGIGALSVTYGETCDFSGTVTLSVGSFNLFSDNTVFNASGTDLIASLNFNDPDNPAFEFHAGTLSVSVSKYLTLTMSDTELDPEAGADEYLLEIGTAEALLPTLGLGGTSGNFAIEGDGDLVTLGGEAFFVTITFDNNTAGTLKWPEWLPIQITDLGLSWDDFNVDPLDFKIIMSASIGCSEIEGIPLDISGYVDGVVIDLGMMDDGKFPIIDIGGVSISISGDIFGGKLDASLIIGIVKLDAENNILSSTDRANPVDKTVFYAAVEGGFSFGGMTGFNLRMGLCELGPLSVHISAGIPILIEPTSGLSITNFRAGVTFARTLPSITDPNELRNPEFKSAQELTSDEWLGQMKQQIVNLSSTGGGWDDLTENMVIEGGATLYSAYISEMTFRADIDIKISTDGKFLINARNEYLNGTISHTMKLYANFGNINSEGGMTLLFLSDIPDSPQMLTLRGSLEFIFIDNNEQQVDPESEMATGFQLRITGGVDINPMPVVSFTLEGELTLSFTENYLKLEVNGNAEISPFGTIASCAGIVIIDNSGSTTELWGVFKLETNLSFLEELNIFTHGEILMHINTSDTLKYEVLELPGIGEESFELQDNLFSIQIDGYLTFKMEEDEWFHIDGEISLEIEQDGLRMFNSAELLIGTRDNPFLRYEAIGFLMIRSDGIVAKMDLELNVNFPQELGIEMSADYLLLINTTGADQSYIIPDHFLPVNGSREVFVARGPPVDEGTGQPYFYIHADGNLLFLNTLQVTGTFEFLISPEILYIHADASIDLDPLGSIAAIGDFEITGEGVVLSLQLGTGGGTQAIGMDLFSFSAQYRLELNTTATEKTIDRIQTDLDGSVAVREGPIAAHSLCISAGGSLTVGNLVEFQGAYRIEIVSDGFSVDFESLLILDTLGSMGVSGQLRVSSSGVVGVLDAYGKIRSPGMFEINGKFLLEINTTNTAQTIQRLNIDSESGHVIGLRMGTIAATSFRLSVGGRLSIVNSFIVSGSIDLAFNKNGFDLLFNATIHLGGFGTMNVSGGAVIHNDVLAINLDIGAKTIDFPLIYISGSFTLQINTSSTDTYQGIAPNTFKCTINASVNLFSVFSGSGEMSLGIENGIFEIAINNLEVNFFISSINISGYLNSKGNFSFTASWGFNIGNIDFKAYGSIGVTISNNGVSAGGKVHARFFRFDATLASASLSVNFNPVRFVLSIGCLLGEITVSGDLNGFELDGFLGDVAEFVGDVVDSVLDFGADVAEFVIDGIEVVGDALSDLGQEILNLGEAALDFVDGVVSDIGDIIGDITDWFGGLFESENTEIVPITVTPHYTYTTTRVGDRLDVRWNGEGAANIKMAVINGTFVVDGPDFTESVAVAQTIHYHRDWSWNPFNFGWQPWHVVNTTNRNRDISFSNMRSIDLSGIETIQVIGTSGDDTVVVDSSVSKSVTIYGNEGNDTLVGGAGDDIIYGGAGEDVVFGSFGNDTLYGNDEDDTIFGGYGNDYLYGGDGNDCLNEEYVKTKDNSRSLEINMLSGGSGEDILFGSPGDDTMHGGDNNDVLIGNDGNDLLYGDSGKDGLCGVNGNDVYCFADMHGNDVFSDVTGNETLDFSAVTVDIDIYIADQGFICESSSGTVVIPAVTSIEKIITGIENDTLYIETLEKELMIDTNAGNDIVNIAHSSNLVSGITSSVIINCGSGTDGIIINNSAYDSDTAGAITSSSISGLGLSSVISYEAAEHLTIYTGQGNDEVVVEETHAASTSIFSNGSADIINIRNISGRTNIQTGEGNDIVTVCSSLPLSGGTVNGINGLLTINTGDGNDSLYVDDSGETSPGEMFLTAVTISGLGMSEGINYSNVDNLYVYTGEGIKTLLIESTHSAVTSIVSSEVADTVNILNISGPTSVQTGAGTDVVTVGEPVNQAGGLVDTISALLTIDMGDGNNDALIIDDCADTLSNTLTIDQNRIEGLGMSDGIHFNDVEVLNIKIGDGNDDVNIDEFPGGDITIENTEGNDTYYFCLGDTAFPDMLSYLTINDSSGMFDELIIEQRNVEIPVVLNQYQFDCENKYVLFDNAIERETIIGCDTLFTARHAEMQEENIFDFGGNVSITTDSQNNISDLGSTGLRVIANSLQMMSSIKASHIIIDTKMMLTINRELEVINNGYMDITTYGDNSDISVSADIFSSIGTQGGGAGWIRITSSGSINNNGYTIRGSECHLILTANNTIGTVVVPVYTQVAALTAATNQAGVGDIVINEQDDLSLVMWENNATFEIDGYTISAVSQMSTTVQNVLSQTEYEYSTHAGNGDLHITLRDENSLLLQTSGVISAENITLISDDIDLCGEGCSVAGTGVLTIRAFAHSWKYLLGTATEIDEEEIDHDVIADEAFDNVTFSAMELSDRDLGAIDDGFTQIVIGCLDSGNSMTVGNIDFLDTVHLESEIIDIRGSLELVNDNENIYGNDITINAETLTIHSTHLRDMQGTLNSGITAQNINLIVDDMLSVDGWIRAASEINIQVGDNCTELSLIIGFTGSIEAGRWMADWKNPDSEKTFLDESVIAITTVDSIYSAGDIMVNGTNSAVNIVTEGDMFLYMGKITADNGSVTIQSSYTDKTNVLTIQNTVSAQNVTINDFGTIFGPGRGIINAEVLEIKVKNRVDIATDVEIVNVCTTETGDVAIVEKDDLVIHQVIVADGNLAITLQGENARLTHAAGDVSAENITFISDDIDLLGGNNSVTGSGILTMRAISSDWTYLLGTASEISGEEIDHDTTLDGALGNETFSAFELSGRDIAAIRNGFTTIVIGNNDSDTTMILGKAGFQDALVLKSNTVMIKGSIELIEDPNNSYGNDIEIDAATLTIHERHIRDSEGEPDSGITARNIVLTLVEKVTVDGWLKAAYDIRISVDGNDNTEDCMGLVITPNGLIETGRWLSDWDDPMSTETILDNSRIVMTVVGVVECAGIVKADGESATVQITTQSDLIQTQGLISSDIGNGSVVIESDDTLSENILIIQGTVAAQNISLIDFNMVQTNEPGIICGGTLQIKAQHDIDINSSIYKLYAIIENDGDMNINENSDVEIREISIFSGSLNLIAGGSITAHEIVQKTDDYNKNITIYSYGDLRLDSIETGRNYGRIDLTCNGFTLDEINPDTDKDIVCDYLWISVGTGVYGGMSEPELDVTTFEFYGLDLHINHEGDLELKTSVPNEVSLNVTGTIHVESIKNDLTIVDASIGGDLTITAPRDIVVTASNDSASGNIGRITAANISMNAGRNIFAKEPETALLTASLIRTLITSGAYYNAEIDIKTNTDVITAQILNASGNITINEEDSIVAFGVITADGSIDIEANGDIRVVFVAGYNSTSDNAITITNMNGTGEVLVQTLLTTGMENQGVITIESSKEIKTIDNSKIVTNTLNVKAQQSIFIHTNVDSLNADVDQGSLEIEEDNDIILENVRVSDGDAKLKVSGDISVDTLIVRNIIEMESKGKIRMVGQMNIEADKLSITADGNVILLTDVGELTVNMKHGLIEIREENGIIIKEIYNQDGAVIILSHGETIIESVTIDEDKVENSVAICNTVGDIKIDNINVGSDSGQITVNASNGNIMEYGSDAETDLKAYAVMILCHYPVDTNLKIEKTLETNISYTNGIYDINVNQNARDSINLFMIVDDNVQMAVEDTINVIYYESFNDNITLNSNGATHDINVRYMTTNATVNNREGDIRLVAGRSINMRESQLPDDKSTGMDGNNIEMTSNSGTLDLFGSIRAENKIFFISNTNLTLGNNYTNLEIISSELMEFRSNGGVILSNGNYQSKIIKFNITGSNEVDFSNSNLNSLFGIFINEEKIGYVISKQ